MELLFIYIAQFRVMLSANNNTFSATCSLFIFLPFAYVEISVAMTNYEQIQLPSSFFIILVRIMDSLLLLFVIGVADFFKKITLPI